MSYTLCPVDLLHFLKSLSSWTASKERVILDGSANYLMSFSILDEIGFYYHKSLRVLLCRHGHGAFLPDAAPGHARSAHNVSIASFDDEEFKLFCVNNLDCGDTCSVSSILPTPNGPPVQLVDRYEGLACGLQVDQVNCTFCCRSKDHMEVHIRREHRDRNDKVSNCYRPSTVQTLYPHVGRVFFQVEPGLEAIPFNDPWNHVLRDYIPNLPLIPVSPPDTEREVTPFLKAMGWEHHLSHFRTDRSKRGLILSLQCRPTEHEGHFSRLAEAVLKYIQLGVKICEDHSQSFTIRQILIYGKDIPR